MVEQQRIIHEQWCLSTECLALIFVLIYKHCQIEVSSKEYMTHINLVEISSNEKGKIRRQAIHRNLRPSVTPGKNTSK